MGKLVFDAIHARLDALERAMFGQVRRRLTKRDVAELEGVNPRTIMRGVGRLYAKPEIINKRLYWWSDTYRLQRGKPDTAAARAARNPGLRKPAQPQPGS
jgi:hypothetical protein